MPECSDQTAVNADERLLEDLRAGAEPPTHDAVADLLAAWRTEVHR